MRNLLNLQIYDCKRTHHLHNISVDALDAISCAAPCGLQTLEDTFIGIRPSEALIQRCLPQVLAKSLQSFEPVDATLSFYPSGNPKLKCTPTSRNRIYLSSVEKGRRRSRVWDNDARQLRNNFYFLEGSQMCKLTTPLCLRGFKMGN